MGDEAKNHNDLKEIPKGCVAIKVGQEEMEGEQERFVVPVTYMNHPLFLKLLKEAEEEYGFDQDGLINIPCKPAVVRQACAVIEKEMNSSDEHHQNNHHHHHHLVSCFKA